MKGDVRGIKLDIENDLVPSNKVALEMLLDHSKRFIKLDDKVRNISDSLANKYKHIVLGNGLHLFQKKNKKKLLHKIQMF